MDGLVPGGELTAAGTTFRPSALESLSHFPITIAAHMADGELAVLIEVVDGALGATTAATLGRRVLTTRRATAAALGASVARCQCPLRGRGDPAARSGHPEPAGGARHPRPVRRGRGQNAGQYRGQLDRRHAELSRAGHPCQRLAAKLVARGVEPETPVAIRLFRSPQYIVAMLAVLKAGGMCVPIEPGMPQNG